MNNKLGLHDVRVSGVGLLLLLFDSHQYFILGWDAGSDVMVVRHNLLAVTNQLNSRLVDRGVVVSVVYIIGLHHGVLFEHDIGVLVVWLWLDYPGFC